MHSEMQNTRTLTRHMRTTLKNATSEISDYQGKVSDFMKQNPLPVEQHAKQHANDVHQKQLDDDGDRESTAQSGDEELIRQADDDKACKEDNTMDRFLERVEYQPPTSRRRSWILRSGTDVEKILAQYVETIPETHRCLNLAYWI